MTGRQIIFHASIIAAFTAAFTLAVSAQPAAVKKPAGSKPPVTAGRSQNDSLTALTSEDVQIIIQDEAKGNPGALTELANSAEQRKKVLENLKEALAFASEARKTGFAAEDSIKMQLDLARKETLANAYNEKLRADAGKTGEAGTPFDQIDEKALAAFFAAPANKAKYAAAEEKFLSFINGEQAKLKDPVEMSDEQKLFIVSEWKKVEYGAAKAEALRLEDKKTSLSWKLQQTLILVREYSKAKLKDKLAPTDAEVKAYIAANPRFDKSGMRAKAEDILAKIKAGGDFAKLADQYSEDPGNKDPQTGAPQGGFYDWHSKNGYVKEFADAAWALEAGQVSAVVETQFGYHIIKLEGKRTVKNEADGSNDEQVKVRHILISTEYKEEPDPNTAAALDTPYMSMEDGARLELRTKKQKEIVEDILLRNPISLPADFTVIAEAASEPGAAESGKTAGAKPKNSAGTKNGKTAPRVTRKRS